MAFLDKVTGKDTAKKAQEFQQAMLEAQRETNIFQSKIAKQRSLVEANRLMYNTRLGRFQKRYQRRLAEQIGRENIRKLHGRAVLYDVQASAGVLSATTIADRAKQTLIANDVQSNVRDTTGRTREAVRDAKAASEAKLTYAASVQKWQLYQQAEKLQSDLHQQHTGYAWDSNVLNVSRRHSMKLAEFNQSLHDAAIDMAAQPAPTVPYTGPSLLQQGLQLYSLFSVAQGVTGLFTGGGGITGTIRAPWSGGLTPGVYGPQ